jgi:hypothetical protein
MTPKEKIIKALDGMTPKAEKNIGKKVITGNGWTISFGMMLFNMYCTPEEPYPFYNGIPIRLSPLMHICGILLEHVGDYNYSEACVFCRHMDCKEDEELATSCLLE